VEYIEELPRTATGKLQRFKVRQLAVESGEPETRAGAAAQGGRPASGKPQAVG